MSININGVKLQTTINNTKHPQYSHTIPYNIPSQTIFNLNTMAFFGETSTQTISNSRLAFIFLNRSIIRNKTNVYFQCPTPISMRVPQNCSFETLNRRIHNRTSDDDDVYTMLMCNDQYSCVGPIELLCTINRTSDDILNLL